MFVRFVEFVAHQVDCLSVGQGGTVHVQSGPTGTRKTLPGGRTPNDPTKSARGRTVPNEMHGNGKGTGTTQECEETAREREGNGSNAGRKREGNR